MQISEEAFKRIKAACEKPAKANDALKAYLKEGKALLTRPQHTSQGEQDG